MHKTLVLLALLGVGAQANAAVFAMTPVPRDEPITLEDFMAREKRCKELGGKSEPVGYRVGYNKVVVTGLECIYNGSVFQIPKQKEQVLRM